MDYLQNINEKLTKLESNSRKQLIYARIRCLFALASFACILVILIAVVRFIPSLQDVQTLITDVGTLVENVDTLVENADTLISSAQTSVEQMQSTLDSIHLDTLNQAMEDLASVIERLERVTSFFK